MRIHHERRGVSEIVGILLMLAVVVSLGVAIYAFAGGGMNRLSQGFVNAKTGQQKALAEKIKVEQVAFTIGTPGVLSVNGFAAGCFGGATQSAPCTTGTSSGSATLTTTNTNDVIVVLVADQNTGASLRTVSGVTATGLTFLKRSGGSINSSPFSDVEVWYAIAASPLSAVVITVTLSGSCDDASVMAFGVSGANTATPWDPNVSLPAATTATTASIPTVSGVSTSNANDMVLGFTGLLTSSDASFPAETAGSGFALITAPQVDPGGVGGSEAAAEYKIVSATQSSSTVAFGTSTDAADNWIIVGDAIQAAAPSTSGADVYVRNVGSIQSTLASVYITDLTSNAFVSQTTISTALTVGTVVDVPHTTLTFTPSHGHTYSFVVTSSLGNSVTYDAEAT